MESVNRGVGLVHPAPVDRVESKEEGFCGKVMAVVKNIFFTIIYYLTCGYVDLSGKNVEKVDDSKKSSKEPAPRAQPKTLPQRVEESIQKAVPAQVFRRFQQVVDHPIASCSPSPTTRSVVQEACAVMKKIQEAGVTDLKFEVSHDGDQLQIKVSHQCGRNRGPVIGSYFTRDKKILVGPQDPTDPSRVSYRVTIDSRERFLRIEKDTIEGYRNAINSEVSSCGIAVDPSKIEAVASILARYQTLFGGLTPLVLRYKVITKQDPYPRVVLSIKIDSEVNTEIDYMALRILMSSRYFDSKGPLTTFLREKTYIDNLRREFASREPGEGHHDGMFPHPRKKGEKEGKDYWEIRCNLTLPKEEHQPIVVKTVDPNAIKGAIQGVSPDDLNSVDVACQVLNKFYAADVQDLRYVFSKVGLDQLQIECAFHESSLPSVPIVNSYVTREMVITVSPQTKPGKLRIVIDSRQRFITEEKATAKRFQEDIVQQASVLRPKIKLEEDVVIELSQILARYHSLFGDLHPFRIVCVKYNGLDSNTSYVWINIVFDSGKEPNPEFGYIAYRILKTSPLGADNILDTTGHLISGSPENMEVFISEEESVPLEEFYASREEDDDVLCQMKCISRVEDKYTWHIVYTIKSKHRK